MIHIFSQLGMTLVLDVHSGAIHVVDEEAATLIRLREHLDSQAAAAAFLADHPTADPAQVALGLEQIEGLIATGRLYSQEQPLAAADVPPEPRPLKALCLNVAHSCNLACSYCFAAQGLYQGKSALMPYETGRQALDFLVRQSGSRRNLEVDFFGGEPLLNWQVVKQLVAYGRSLEQPHGKRFRFTLTTNGMLMDDEVIDFCLREMHNVVLSLDGRPETHDRFRVDHKGRGSYHQVLPRFQAFVRRRGQQGYYIRGTFTRHNLDFVQDVLHMADLGFTQLSMEPMVAPAGDPEAFRQEDLPILYEQYELLASQMLSRKRAGQGFDFYHYMIDLAHGPCMHKRLAGCGVGTEYLAVTPAGQLYPCHQFIGDDSYLMGDVWQGVTNRQASQGFLQADLLDREECKACWARLFCAGGCSANGFHATGDIRGLYTYGCELFRKRLECALALNAALQEDA